jgi:hypothetical protein
VPGSVAPTVAAPSTPTGARSADNVRDRMSSFQRGLSLGRHSRAAGPGEQAPADYDVTQNSWSAPGEWPNDHTAEDSR